MLVGLLVGSVVGIREGLAVEIREGVLVGLKFTKKVNELKFGEVSVVITPEEESNIFSYTVAPLVFVIVKVAPYILS
jgi:hypothetical protein